MPKVPAVALDEQKMKEGHVANEDGDDWAWIGEQKFATFRNGQNRDIRFVTLQDARTALSEERARIRREWQSAHDEWYRDTIQYIPGIDAEHIAGLALWVTQALDRACPEEPT